MSELVCHDAITKDGEVRHVIQYIDRDRKTGRFTKPLVRFTMDSIASMILGFCAVSLLIMAGIWIERLRLLYH